MRVLRLLLLNLLLLSVSIAALSAQGFDIQAFSDSTKYGWTTYLERQSYRDDLANRQSLLQLYELEAQTMNANIIKSAIVPGWGQFSTKANTKATIILGTELVLLGSALYFYDQAMSNYRLYRSATQVEDIENYYKAAQGPHQYSFILLGFAGVVWAYNLFDVIQSTESYNARLWEDIMNRNQTRNIQFTPNGIEVRF